MAKLAKTDELEIELKVLDGKLTQLKLSYDRYFLGTQPREPSQLRAEVQKVIVFHSNHAIKNTAMRFKFSSICSRFQSFKRQWDDTLRKMEDGSYSRHRFKAKLHQQDAGPRPAPGNGDAASTASPGELFDAYVEARKSCGQDVEGLTPAKLERVIEGQKQTLRKKYGDSDFRFRVVVEKGRTKLKASRATSD